MKKEEKAFIQPKPIEELSNYPVMIESNKKMTPPDQKHSSSGGFASAFKPKQEQNIKNASSWSSLGQANSPQSNASGNSRQTVKDSFKAFQKQAKEKADREKALQEHAELRRQQQQQAEKERLRLENEKRKEKEEEDALEKARFVEFCIRFFVC